MTAKNSLDSRYYTDPVIYAQERERLFKTAWWLLGPAFFCQANGQYLSATVCGWPVFAIRGEDGVLRAFHNVCRHRGSALLEDGHGQCRTVTCPYHAWGYASDGRLLATPRFEASGCESPLDKSALSLVPVQVREWRGMVFVRIAQEGVEFERWIQTLDGFLDEFAGLESMTYHGEFVVEGQANWKTYCDNTVEGYHLPSVHPRLATAVRQGTVDIQSHDDGGLVIFDVDYGGESSTLRGNRGLWAYLFPGFQLAISANAYKIERVEAIAIDQVKSTNWAWYTNLDDEAIADSFAWSQTVVEEDLGICEKVQLNMTNGIYRQGPLSPLQEQHVAGLQALIRRKLDG